MKPDMPAGMKKPGHGSLTITFEDGIWKSHDNFFWG
jgi:hypothetical protein